MKNKILTKLVLLSLMTSACTPPGSSDGSRSPSASQKSIAWQYFRTLTAGDNANIPLAEALGNLLREQSPEVLVELRHELEKDSVLLIEEGGRYWVSMQQSIIVGEGSAFLADSYFLKGTLNLNRSEIDRNQSFQNQINLKVSGIVQSVAFQNLMKSYDEQIRSDSADLAGDIVKQIKIERPQILEKIESTRFLNNRSRQTEQIIIYLKQADYLFDKYKISDADANRLVIYTAVAGALAVELSKNNTVQRLIQKAQDIKDYSDRINSILTLTKVIQKHGEELKRDSLVIKKSVKGIYKDVKALIDEVDRGDLNLSKEGQKQARMILNDMLNGKALSDEANLSPDEKEQKEKETAAKYKELEEKGFFQRKRALTNNFENFMGSADRAARSLDKIVGATLQIASVVGVKLDPSVHQALQTAQKVSQGVQAVASVVKAFQGGGFVGALSAFSGGPATMALTAFGGGLAGEGPDPAIMSELAEIKQSLAEIKAMQREILENQKRTMTMIKDLALMVEEYHRQEMRAITDLNENVLDVKEGLSEIEMASFNSCEAMISFALNMSSQEIPASIHKVNGSSIELARSILRDVTNSEKGLRQFINNASAENFPTCQKEMSLVFISKKMRKFQRSLWVETTGEKRDGGQISRAYYDPALMYLRRAVSGREGRWQKMGLHLPVLKMDAILQRKAFYLRQPGMYSNLNELEILMETNKLEKYVATLLVLYPYLTIDFSIWDSPLAEIVKVGSAIETKMRSMQMLQNAFERIQIAIAQEALLAGEPLLPFLSDDWLTIMGERTECEGSNEMGFCFLRRNHLMMQNLLTYRLLQSGLISIENTGDRKSRYQWLLQNPKELANLLFVQENRIFQKDGVVYLKLSEDGSLVTNFPDLDIVAEGRVQYTESMARMIRLQHKIADELIKLQNSSFGYSKAVLAKSLFVN